MSSDSSFYLPKALYTVLSCELEDLKISFKSFRKYVVKIIN